MKQELVSKSAAMEYELLHLTVMMAIRMMATGVVLFALLNLAMSAKGDLFLVLTSANQSSLFLFPL